MDWRERRQEYERRVTGLVALIDECRAKGDNWEAVARTLVAARNLLKIEIRASDDAQDVALLEQRGHRMYNHPVGPTADELFDKYRDWELVARAACRPRPLSGLSREAILRILRSEQ